MKVVKKKKQGIILGQHPADKHDIILKYGRYGKYLVHNKSNITIPKELKSKELTLDDAIIIINQSK